MKYDQEVIERIGVAGQIEVLISQPHLERDLTMIGLDTPDGRRWELDGDDAATLAELLRAAGPRLVAVCEARGRDAED